MGGILRAMNRPAWLKESICIKADGKYIWKEKFSLNYNASLCF